MWRKLNSILLSLIFVAFCGAVDAQELKVVESSAKTRPSWIRDLVRDNVVGVASGSDINVAQEDALLDVKQRIAQSIASNITVEVMQSSTTSIDNGSVDYESVSMDLVRSTTDKIPFLQSISLSKAADFYWEKLSDKKKSVVLYKYYVKYPFTSIELQRLVDEFNKEQAMINNTIEQMVYELSTFDRVETIEKNMSTLRALRPKLADNDARITQIDELVNSYRNQYKHISIVEAEHVDKRILLQLFIDGREVSTSQIPTHKSSCADRVTKRADGRGIVVTYDDYTCRAGDDNWLEFTFKFGVNYISSKVFIKK